MKKNNIFLNVSSILFVLIVHIALCVLYNSICFLDGVYIWGNLQGVPLIIVTVLMFLLAPLCYWISGRLFTRFANKKLYLGTVWTFFSVLSVLGAVAIFFPDFEDFYLLVNAPSYMYYLLFKKSVLYISVPAMLLTGLIPAFFLRIGYVKKSRTKNEITMEELDEKLQNKITE